MGGHIIRTGLMILVLLGLAACAGVKPFDYQPTADEMKPGSGLISGKDGEFVIYRKPRAEPAEKKPEATPSP